MSMEKRMDEHDLWKGLDLNHKRARWKAKQIFSHLNFVIHILIKIGILFSDMNLLIYMTQHEYLINPQIICQ